MDDLTKRHLEDLYGLNPNIPPMAFQFPRLPPRLAHPMFRVHENPAREQFSKQAASISQKLHGFQQMYQQYASGLLSKGSVVIPPGHPLYSRQNSIEALQTKNDKLLKENLELKKKLEKQSKDQIL